MMALQQQFRIIEQESSGMPSTSKSQTEERYRRRRYIPLRERRKTSVLFHMSAQITNRRDCIRHKSEIEANIALEILKNYMNQSRDLRKLYSQRVLSEAIYETFTNGFMLNPGKQVQWSVFCTRVLAEQLTFSEIIVRNHAFPASIYKAIVRDKQLIMNEHPEKSEGCSRSKAKSHRHRINRCAGESSFSVERFMQESIAFVWKNPQRYRS